MKRVKGSSVWWYKKEAVGHSIYRFDNGIYKLVAQVQGFSQVHEYIKAKGGL